MRRFAVLASVVAVALIGAACAETGQSSSASSLLTAPSALDAASDETAATTAKGGGGGKAGGGNGGGGSAGGSGSLSLVMVTDKNGNGSPNWSDTVTFNVSTTATTEPTVELLCAQNGTNVYGSTAGFYDSYPWPWTKNMVLSSSAWQGGAADCTATLFPLGDRRSVLATVKFTAGA